MNEEARQRFRKVSDWHQFLAKRDNVTGADLYSLRTAVYKDIEGLRGRPLIVYATDFLSANPKAPVALDLSDVDGFIDLVESVDDADAVDILIHSPGGSPEATERIVHVIRERFKKVGFLVPHSAYSAATMLALSGDEIVLHPSATLGPIDPQVNGTPTRSIRRGFEKVRDLLKDEGPAALPAYIPLIEKLSLELLEICEDYENLAKELATEWLTQYMFAGTVDEDRRGKILEAVEYLSSYDQHRTHSRPLTSKKLEPFDLNLVLAEDELRSLLREAHVLLTGILSMTEFVKLFENGAGLSWGRKHSAKPSAPKPSPDKESE